MVKRGNLKPIKKKKKKVLFLIIISRVLKMLEDQNQRKTSMTEEKFNNYNKWCAKSSVSSFENNNNRNFQRNADNNNDNNTKIEASFNYNYNYSFQQKRKFNDNNQQSQSNNNNNKRPNNGEFTFNPNAYYHPSMVEDPWNNVIINKHKRDDEYAS